jgi:membrane protein
LEKDLFKNKPWSRKKLNSMLIHGFLGTIADNIVEIGWILCFSLIADKLFVEKVTVMFGVNDAFWVILSSIYYAARTSMMSTLPKIIEREGEHRESKVLKNYIYLFYSLLLPVSIISFIFMPQLLNLLGVNSSDFGLYLPYFRLTILSILFAAPWSIFIPSYLRSRGRSKEALMLDHAVAWSMTIGIFITTHLFGLGVKTAVLVNMITNAIPLYWFLIKKPIPAFFKKGFEFSFEEIKSYWMTVKWELVRRLAPRVAAVIGISFMIKIDPIYAGIKYWVSNLLTFTEGWVDASAGLLNSHVSRNVGLNKEKPYSDNNFVFIRALVGLILTVCLIYFIAVFGLKFLPNDLYFGVISPIIYLFAFIEISSKLRYYSWLSISRSFRLDLNKIAQLCYAIPTVILTPTLLYLFLNYLRWGFESIFLVGAIVSTVQCLLAEFYFKKNLK